MRAVLDSSVWVAGSLSKSGASHEVIFWGLKGSFEIIVSSKILDECLAAFEKPYLKEKVTRSQRAALKKVLQQRVRQVSLELKAVRDPEDDHVLAAALQWNADYVVSLDYDLTDLKNYENILLISPSHFLKILRRAL